MEAATKHRDEAWAWARAILRPDAKIEDFADSGKFKRLDSNLGAACRRILRGEINRNVILKTREIIKETGNNIRGRQILWMITQEFGEETHDAFWNDEEGASWEVSPVFSFTNCAIPFPLSVS